MLHIQFVLNTRKGDTPDTERPIMCQMRYKVNNQTCRLNFSTGQGCRVRSFKKQRVYHTAEFATQKNERLAEIRERAERIYRDSFERGTMPTPERFKEQILNGVFKVEQERDMVRDLADFVQYHRDRGTHRGSLNHLLQLQKHLDVFTRKSKMALAYDQMNLSFYARFLAYLKSPEASGRAESYKTNTVGNVVKKLKMFLNYAKSNGWNKFEFYKHPDFKIPNERVQNIYLEQRELNALAALDLRKAPGLAAGRDWFLLACEIGMRNGDYKQCQRTNLHEVEGGIDFVYTPSKTSKSSGQTVTVPLSQTAYGILNRYGFDMPAPISNQKTNKALKRISEMAGITKEVTTHTARRTFATLRYLEGWPITQIMKITGHATEREFFKYLCIEGEENAQLIRQSNEKYKINKPGALNSKLRIA